MVAGRPDGLQFAKGTRLREGAAWIGIARARRWIVGTEEAGKICPFGTLVVDVEHQGLGQLMLEADVPVLHVRRLQVASDGMLRGGNHLRRIKRAKELVGARRGRSGDVDPRQIVGDRVRPIAAARRPFPTGGRVEEDTVGATNHRARE